MKYTYSIQIVNFVKTEYYEQAWRKDTKTKGTS